MAWPYDKEEVVPQQLGGPSIPSASTFDLLAFLDALERAKVAEQERLHGGVAPGLYNRSTGQWEGVTPEQAQQFGVPIGPPRTSGQEPQGSAQQVIEWSGGPGPMTTQAGEPSFKRYVSSEPGLPADYSLPEPPEGFEAVDTGAPADYTSGLVSTFGYNDPEDTGVGAWGDVTNHPDAYGVALPEEELRRHFGDPNAARGQLVEIAANGKTLVAPIVDKGPAPWVTARQGPTIDVTEGVRRDLGGTGLDEAQWRVIRPPEGFAPVGGAAEAAGTQGAAGVQGRPPPPEGFSEPTITIQDAIDPSAPYMAKPRDPSGIHRIIMHGNVGMGFDELVQYGRQVDPQRGFAPGYHFYIAKDGTVVQGAPVDRITNHTLGENADSIGIVIDGADNGQMPTPEQEVSAKLLVSQLGTQYGIDPKNVVGHGELQPNRREALEGGHVARDIREQGYLGVSPSAPAQELPPPPEGFSAVAPEAAPVPELARTEVATPVYGGTPSPTPLQGRAASYPPFTPENIRRAGEPEVRQGIPVYGWTPSPTPIEGVPRGPTEPPPVALPGAMGAIVEKAKGVGGLYHNMSDAVVNEITPRLIRELGTGFFKIAEGATSGLAQFLKPVRNPYVDIEDPKKAIKQADEDLPDLLEQKRVEKERIQLYLGANMQDSKAMLQALGRLDDIGRKIEFAERASQGDITEAPLSGGQASRVLAPLAKPISEVNEAWREKVQPFIDETQNTRWYNQAASSIGASLPSTAAAIASSGVGLFTMWAQQFAQSKDEYRETVKAQGKPYDEEKASQYAWEQARRQTPWEAFGDLAAAAGFKGVLQLKNVFKSLPKNIMKADATTAGRWFTETLHELSPTLKKIGLLPAGMAGEVAVTTPMQSIEDAAVAEKYGLAKPTTAAEKLAKAYSPETLGPAAIQTAAMFGLPTAVHAAKLAAQTEPAAAPPQAAAPPEAAAPPVGGKPPTLEVGPPFKEGAPVAVPPTEAAAAPEAPSPAPPVAAPAAPTAAPAAKPTELKTFAELPAGMGIPVGGTAPPVPEAAARMAEAPRTEAERARVEAEAETRRLMEEAPGATEEELDILEKRFAKGFMARGAPTAEAAKAAPTEAAQPKGAATLAEWAAQPEPAKPPAEAAPAPEPVKKSLLGRILDALPGQAQHPAYEKEEARIAHLSAKQVQDELGPDFADRLKNNPITKQLGIRADYGGTTGPMAIDYDRNGNISLKVNPRLLLAMENASGRTGEAINKLIGEELTHAAETLLQKEDWQKAQAQYKARIDWLVNQVGEPPPGPAIPPAFTFTEHVEQEGQRRWQGIKDAIAKAPEHEQKALYQAALDSFNTYYAKDIHGIAEGPIRLQARDAGKIFDEIHKQGKATNWASEFVRQAQQLRAQGDISENTWIKIFNAFKEWLGRTVARLKEALPGVQEGKFGKELQAHVQRIDDFLQGKGAAAPSLAQKGAAKAATPAELVRQKMAKAAPTEVARNVARQGFYSRLETTIAQKMPKSATPEQAKGIINGAGLKPEEIKWSGVHQAIDRIAAENGGKIPKEALQAYLANEGQVRMVEVTLSETEKGSPEFGRRYNEITQLREAGQITDEEAARRVERLRQEFGPRPTRFGQYTLPGGENYREVVLTMGGQRDTSGWRAEKADAAGYPGMWFVYDSEGKKLKDRSGTGFWDGDNAQEAIRRAATENPVGYKSTHFPEISNYVAHSRLNDRTDAQGKPGLFIEEIQSDLHQQGREKGYKPKETVTELLYKLKEAQEKGQDEEAIRRQLIAAREGVPEAPFAKDWPVQMFKRALRDAVATGKSWIGWTSGETQAERYDLSKQVESVSYGDGFLRVKTKAERGGTREFINEEVPPEKIADYIGKEAAQRLLDSPKEVIGKQGDEIIYRQTLQGEGLKVGGEGMKGFYDKMLPTEVGKYIKQWGGKVEQGGYVSTPIWRVEITPAMRQGVAEEGQALFARPAPKEAPQAKPKPTEKAKPKPKPETAEEEAARFEARSAPSAPPPIPSGERPDARLKRVFANWWRGAAERLRRTPGLEFGGNAMLRHQDNLAALKGELTAALPKVNTREVNEQVAQYWAEQLGPGPSHGRAALPAHPEATRIVNEQVRLKQEIKDRNQRLGKIKNPGDESEYPLMLSAETLRAHQKGSGPHWQRLKDDMVNEGIIPKGLSNEEIDRAADVYLKKVENAQNDNKSIDKPGLRLPMSAYELRPGGFINWASRAAEKAAARDAFGSTKYTPPGTPPGVAGKNLFDRMRERTKDPRTKHLIDVAEAHAYRQSTPNAWSEIISAGTNVTSGMALGNVKSTSKNLLSALAGNITRWPTSFLKRRQVIESIPETKARGLLQNDLLDSINDINHPSLKERIKTLAKGEVAEAFKGGPKSFAGGMLKYHGFSAAEAFVRSMGLVGAKGELAAARKAYGDNRKSKRALQFMARAQRMGFANPEALLQEGDAGGPLTDAFYRRAVNRVHAGYSYADVPLYMSGEQGSLFRQFGKYMLEHFNTFYEDIFKPMLRVGPGNLSLLPKETVEVTNQATGMKETIKVPGEVAHLAMYLAAFAAASDLWDFTEEGIFDKASDWEKWTDMLDRLKRGEVEVLGDALTKTLYAMLNLGSFGLAGNYGKQAWDLALGKTNIEQMTMDVPAVSMVSDAVQEVRGLLTRKDWTPAGLMTFADKIGGIFSTYRAVKGPIAQALHANNIDLFNSDITAYKIDRANARASMRRMENVLGIERKPPITGITPTAKTALKDKLNDLVATGRLAEARGLIKEETAKLKDPKSKKELMDDLEASTESKHPLGPGKARRELLMKEAKKRMTSGEYQRVLRIQKEYEKNAVKMGLMKSEGASSKQTQELTEKLSRERKQREFEPGLVEQLMQAVRF